MRTLAPGIVAAAMAITAISPSIVDACSCGGGGTACGGFETSAAVFVGTVQSRADVTETRTYQVLGKAAPEQATQHLYEFGFEVTEAFKGTDGKAIAVRTATNGAACGVGFAPGRTYLVYASQGKDGTYYTGLCSRTQPIDRAAADLAILRKARDADLVTKVQGFVRQYVPSLSGGGTYRAVPNVSVSLDGADRLWEARTDSAGRFALEGLPRGRYTVGPELPNGLHLMNGSRGTIEIGRCGLVDLDFITVTDPPLLGTLRTTDGTPVVGGKVTAIKVERSSPDGPLVERGRMSEYTRGGGAWRFDGLPSGTYIVGVSVAGAPSLEAPFALEYYPEATSREAANLIEVTEGHQAWIDFRPGPAIPKRTLTITVVDDAGTPLEDAVLSVEDEGPPMHAFFSRISRSDAAGRIVNQILEGRRYQLMVRKAYPYSESETVMVPESGDVNLKVTLKPKPR